jgi:hypothetical protein
LEARLAAAGYAAAGNTKHQLWKHADGMFPAIALHAGSQRRLMVRVESVADFLFAKGLDDRVPIDGLPQAAWRRARAAAEGAYELWVVERHGYEGRELVELPPAPVPTMELHREAFRRRQREFERDDDGFAHARRLIAAAKRDLGVDRACDLFFAAEREYWQARNRAGRIQKVRQDSLGLGWANHDHHTYRASREQFANLIGTLEDLGMVCRERFYAGREAGWGAQVLEQPGARIVVFADVDLTPDEVAGDFAHQPLGPQPRLGTVGLWCRLHGEAFLQAGMHHLECQFNFDAAREQLRAAGIGTMKPFTDFPHLRQAFTDGEMWMVGEERIARALAEGYISAAEAERFRTAGAVGSHLEILERNEGYKGFNQTGISEIILSTDPRKH